MKQAVREIESMTESLETSGFDRRQSSAVIRAIANSIDKFAMTPDRMREALERNNDILMERIDKRMDDRFGAQEKRLDDRFAAQDKRLDERFEAQEKLINERFAAERRINDEQFRQQNKRLDAIETSIKTGLGRLFALAVALTSAVVGVLVRVLWF